MARLRANFLEGQVDDNPLASGALTLNSAELASMPAVSAPNYFALTLDPEAANGNPEIIWVTAHAASATSATIERAKEGTLARAHPVNEVWINAITAQDFDDLYAAIATLPGYLPLAGGTMLGDLILNEDPAVPLQAATKSYVDGMGGGDGVPPGTIVAYGGAAAPTGWHLCDGSLHSTTDPVFATLYAAIGTAYGAGPSQFRLPDLRGKFPLGMTSSIAAINALGLSGGAYDHRHTGPEHHHTGGGHQHSGAVHQHNIDPPVVTTTSAGAHTHDSNPAGSHAHSVSDSTGGPSSTVTILHGTGSSATAAGVSHTHSFSGATDTEASHDHSIDSAGAHTHDFNLPTTASGNPINSELTGSAGAVVTTDAGTGNTGTGNPPYQTVNYIIKL